MDTNTQSLLVELIKSTSEKQDAALDSIQTSLTEINAHLTTLNSKTYKHAVDIGRLNLAVMGILGSIGVAVIGALFSHLPVILAGIVGLAQAR